MPIRRTRLRGCRSAAVPGTAPPTADMRCWVFPHVGLPRPTERSRLISVPGHSSVVDRVLASSASSSPSGTSGVHSALAPLKSTNGGALVNNYTTKYGLTVVKNGAHEAPPVGAVMSFASNSDFSAPPDDLGHVAVVSDDTVNSSGYGHIWVIGENQNTYPDGYTDGQSPPMTVTDWQIKSFNPHPYIEWFAPPAPGWLWDSLAVPPDEGPGAFLTYDIACPIKGTCVVVGSYTDAKGYVQGLIETLSGGKWKAIQAPLPVNMSRSQPARLVAVSCPSATYCVAVGGFLPSPKEAAGGLIETLSGDARDVETETLRSSRRAGWLEGSCVRRRWRVRCGESRQQRWRRHH